MQLDRLWSRKVSTAQTPVICGELAHCHSQKRKFCLSPCPITLVCPLDVATPGRAKETFVLTITSVRLSGVKLYNPGLNKGSKDKLKNINNSPLDH
jgi:hypothetical protein